MARTLLIVFSLVALGLLLVLWLASSARGPDLWMAWLKATATVPPGGLSSAASVDPGVDALAGSPT